ncbi:MAG: nickel-dependent lactate racemase [Firmicutes bacterium]|nr:nickel-dependent lactate racemase [Bacillota bacterium]
MEKVELKYGNETINLSIEGAKSVKYLYENKMPVIENAKEEFIHSLEKGAIDSAPLKELIKKDDKVTIIISDITRLWMRQDILCGFLVEYLNGEMGIPFENIAVLIAVGTHRVNSEEDKKKIAGEYAYKNVSVFDHDCDAEDLVCVGTTSFGTEVKVNPLAVGRKVICMSGTVHHIMAGYGGGRKSIVPGIASRQTVRMNHERALDPVKPKSSELVGGGRLSGNPINMDMCEAADFVDITFGINVVVDSASRHSGFFSGNFNTAWRESCAYVQKYYGLPIEYKADIIIASCGGFPKDLNLYQSTKTLFNASRAVKDGGTLLFLAQCPEGSGAGDFFDWAVPLREGRLDEALRKDFTIGGYIFYAACEACRKTDTLLLSQIDPELVKAMEITASDSIEKLMERIDFGGKDVYIMPYGGSVMPQLMEEYKDLCENIKTEGAKE